jgi:hypothetical protein
LTAISIGEILLSPAPDVKDLSFCEVMILMKRSKPSDSHLNSDHGDHGTATFEIDARSQMGFKTLGKDSACTSQGRSTPIA